MRYICSLIFFSIPLFGMGEQLKLSSSTEIMVVTCGPGQEELYSAFGHSAIRVVDSVNNINMIYNYGIFDFDQPNFYGNFAKGYLRYKLGLTRYQHFLNVYIHYNRYVHEQVLNLSLDQKQKVFDFLQWNAQPENSYYFYDYFYDNCSTRIRDVLRQALGKDLRFTDLDEPTGHTIRSLTDLYLQEQPWGDFGIDLALGLPMDRKANNEIATFLPEYLEKACNQAVITAEGRTRPLVRETLITYEPNERELTFQFFTPLFTTMTFLLFATLITFFDTRKQRVSYWFDKLFFGISGLLGCVLLLLWVATDHNAAAYNFNLLWAMPSHLILFFLLFSKKKTKFVKNYFLYVGIVSALSLIGWYPIPQKLHYAIIPLTLAFAIRSWHFYILNTKTSEQAQSSLE